MKSFFLYLSLLVPGLFSVPAPARTQTDSLDRINRVLSEHLRSWRLITHQPRWVESAYREHPASLEVTLPFPDGDRTLTFEQHNIHAPGFQVLNSRNRPVEGLAFPRHYVYRGSRRGKSLGSLSLFSNGDFAAVFSDESGNVNIGRLPDSLSGGRRLFVSWNDRETRKRPSFLCGNDSDERVNRPNTDRQDNLPKRTPGLQSTASDTTCRLTEIYWECDHNMFQQGGSIQGALNQFEAMFNGTAILFENENINIGAKAVKVWDTPDPYTYTTSFTALDDFQSAGNAANWPGQLAHLLSTRPLNLGGVAFLNALCTNFRYGFSNIDFLFSPLPAYSWTVSTIAHELGHNFSSPHTHNCNWEVAPGVLGQIDSCWNAEGGCQEDVIGRVGTIMSYCHLTGSVNLSLGFGPLPGNRIREGFNNMSCVSGTIVIPNFTPVSSGEFCTGDTIRLEAGDWEGYSYRWTGPNGYTSSQRVALVPDAQAVNEGKYGLSLKKAACESREKKTEVIFNCMKIGTLPQAVCAGSPLWLPFSSTGSFNPGNRFRVELSNGAGSFASPRFIDTLETSVPGTFAVNLPANLNYGLNYRIRLVSTDPPYTGKPQSKGLTIQPIGVAPTPVAGERCGAGVVNLSAQGGSNLLWFESPAPLPPIGAGRNFQTPFISESRSYYVQGGSSSRIPAGLPAAQATGQSSLQSDGIIFSVLTTLRIDTVTLAFDAAAPAVSPGVLVLEQGGNVLYRKRIGSTPGQSRPKIALYWRLDPGQDYRIRMDSLEIPLRLAPAGWGNFPVLIPGVLRLERGINSSTAYPYLFAWNVSRFSSCPGPRVAVPARIRPGTVPEVPSLTQTGDSVVSSAQGIAYQWLINGQMQMLNTSRVRGIQNSSYQIRYKTDSCWSEWSPAVVFSVQTGIMNARSQSLQVYPNPGQDNFHLTGFGGPTRLQLTDPLGRVVFSGSLNLPASLRIPGLPDGVYWLRWEKDGRRGGLALRIGN